MSPAPRRVSVAFARTLVALHMVVAVVFALVPLRAAAQGNTGAIRGSVSDEQHLALARASISVEGVEGGLRRSIVAQNDGTFVVAGLQPGEYLLRIEAPGFQPKQLRVQLEVNQHPRLDVALSPKGVEESVDVVETRPLLHLSDGAIGEVVDQQQVSQLPLNGRQFLE